MMRSEFSSSDINGIRLGHLQEAEWTHHKDQLSSGGGKPLCFCFRPWVDDTNKKQEIKEEKLGSKVKTVSFFIVSHLRFHDISCDFWINYSLICPSGLHDSLPPFYSRLIQVTMFPISPCWRGMSLPSFPCIHRHRAFVYDTPSAWVTLPSLYCLGFSDSYFRAQLQIKFLRESFPKLS